MIRDFTNGCSSYAALTILKQNRAVFANYLSKGIIPLHKSKITNQITTANLAENKYNNK